jgi:hypothetical protein
VANVNAATTVVATLLTAETDVTACNDGTNTVTPSGGVLGLGGGGVDIPGLLGGTGGAAAKQSCSGSNGTNGNPNVDTGIPGLLPIICNAEDSSNGSMSGTTPVPSANQTTIPYAVREALTACLLNAGNAPPPLGPGGAPCTGTSLAKITASAAEAAATAPTTGATTSPTTGPTTGATTSPSAPTTGATTSTTSPSGQTTSTTAAPTTGVTTGKPPAAEEVSQVVPAKAVSKLPFTGYDAVTAALIGLVILGSGVLLLEFVRRRSGAN